MRFDWYFEPTTVEECLQLIDQYGPDTRLLAGGTDLVVRLRSRAIKVKAIISLNEIPELERVYRVDGGLQIGTMARLMDLSKSEQLSGPWQVIKTGAGNVSSMQVRNVATIGGNTCNASPSADTVPGLIAVNAVVNIAGNNGERNLPLEDFFVGPGRTVLEKGEMVTGFTLPDLPQGTGTAYKKYAIRGSSDIAIVGVGARLKLSNTGIIEETKLVLSAVAPTPLLVPAIEKLLVGKVLTDELAEQAAQMAADSCTPITDARGTKEYRKEMVRVWTRHVLKEANKNAGGLYAKY